MLATEQGWSVGEGMVAPSFEEQEYLIRQGIIDRGHMSMGEESTRHVTGATCGGGSWSIRKSIGG